MRKLKIILLSFSLALICIVPSTLKAYDFEGNETYYINYCSVPLKTQEDADLWLILSVGMSKRQRI